MGVDRPDRCNLAFEIGRIDQRHEHFRTGAHPRRDERQLVRLLRRDLDRHFAEEFRDSIDGGIGKRLGQHRFLPGGRSFPPFFASFGRVPRRRNRHRSPKLRLHLSDHAAFGICYVANSLTPPW
jgi:hypothetical protein